MSRHRIPENLEPALLELGRGLRFLNFRAHADNTYITRDAYFAEKKRLNEKVTCGDDAGAQA